MVSEFEKIPTPLNEKGILKGKRIFPLKTMVLFA